MAWHRNPELFRGFMQSPKQASIVCSWSTSNQAETGIRRVISNSWFTNYPTVTHMFDCMTCQVVVSLVCPKYVRAKISEIWRQVGSQIAAEKYLIFI